MAWRMLTRSPALGCAPAARSRVPIPPELNGIMNRPYQTVIAALFLTTVAGCAREERGPILAGGREVKSWVADLHDRKPQVRRQAVLKLGNVGDSDPAAAVALAEALHDPDVLVRRDAVHAVAKLTKPGEDILSQLRALSEKDRDPTVRDYAGKALRHFNETR
jgi:HEAT repeat protein